MNITSLKQELDTLCKRLPPKELHKLHRKMGNMKMVYPFNEYMYILSYLLSMNALSLNEFDKLKIKYYRANKYRILCDLSPRAFNLYWRKHLVDVDGRFKRANKMVDPHYSGEYSMWLEGIRVEVKACRAVARRQEGSLSEKFLSYKNKEYFWMNFPQIKVQTADVFVFIGVWLNKIKYWVMTPEEILNNPYYIHQHRGGVNYQIGITKRNIKEFKKYEVPESKLADSIILKKLSPVP